MKIGRSSISVNVATPYTRVGHCDNARWMSVAVLVSLVGNELAQSFKRIIEFWTNMRSFWCQIFLLISLRRNESRRTSQTTRWRYFNRSICRTNALHVQGAKILPEPNVQKPLSHRSSTTFKKNNASVKHSKTIHVFLPLPSPSTC